MSDTSQGDGWWIASDSKWYPPEQHPDYVAPVLQPPVAQPPAAQPPAAQPPAAQPPAAQAPAPQTAIRPAAAPGYAAETVAVPAASQPVGAPQSAPATATQTGPAFAPPGEPTQNFSPDGSQDPSYNLPPKQQASGSSKRTLILGVGALVLVAVLGFLALRFFGGTSAAGGAASPEAAVAQLIASINERDAVGFVDVFDPDEIDAWFGSFGPAFGEFEELDERGESTNEISQVYASVFDSFDYSITGPDGQEISYQVEQLDDNGRISRVRIDGIDFELSVPDTNTAIIVGFGDDPTALDVSKVDGTRAELRDSGAGLAARLFVPGEPTETVSTPGAHIDLVTVEKDGKYFISIGYSFLEAARNQGEFDDFPEPDFGRGYELVDSQSGGAGSPEDVVQTLFTAMESLDYETMLQMTDPIATPYLHDYQPLIDSQISEADRQQALREDSLRFEDLELGTSEWEGRTLVTIGDIRGRTSDIFFLLEADAWCATIDDGFDNERVCLEEGIAEVLRQLDSDLDSRDFIPDATGFIVIERNGRWYLDPLGTLGYYTDHVAEAAALITTGIGGNPATELGNFFVFEGPVARQNAPATAQAESGSAGVALDLSGYPTVRGDRGEFRVAVARVVTDQPGSFVSYDDVPLTGEDWVVVYDSVEPDAELPAIAVSTGGSLDVELFEPQVTEVGVDGFTGQFGGQGRPQVFTFSPDTAGADLAVEGANAETIYGWASTGVALKDPFAGSFIGQGAFVVVQGEPEATFTISVDLFEPEPEPEREPEPEPETEPEPVPTPGSGNVFDDPLANAFASVVEPSGFSFTEVQIGGYFDGCGGPDDPDVDSYLFEDSLDAILVMTNYGTVTRARESFDQLVNIETPCDAFPNVQVNEIEVLGPDDIRIQWELADDPTTVVYEHYRLSLDTIVVATNESPVDLDDQLAILDNW